MEGLVNLVYYFAIPQGTLLWQPIKVAKSAYSRTNIIVVPHSETDGSIAIPISKDEMA